MLQQALIAAMAPFTPADPLPGTWLARQDPVHRVGEGWLYRRVHSATGKAPIERWSTGLALYWVDFVFAGNAKAGAYNPILVTFLTLTTHMRGSSRHLVIVRVLDASARRVSHAPQSNRESDDVRWTIV